MKHFKATAGIGETAVNARDFVRENKDIFWGVFKPLIPYIAALVLIDVVIAYTQFIQNPDDPNIGNFQPGGIIASYFFSCLVITWHRVVLDGPDRFVPMNPFKPEKRDWAFIGMGIGVFLIAFMIPFFVGIISGVIAGLTGMKFMLILIFPATIYAMYLTFKFLFYFPSKATGNDLTLKQSYRLTKGYIWKIIASNFLAAWRVVLVMMGYMFLAFASIAFLGGVAGFSGADGATMGNAAFMMGAAIMIPVTFYLQPLLTVLGVTVLSNYYQHAMQNRPVPPKAKDASLEKDPMNQSDHQDMNKARKALDK
jgi:hypothetical protein